MVPLCNFPQMDLKSVQQMKNLICRSSKMGRCVGKQLLPGSIFQICGGDGFLAVNQCLVGYVPVTRHESGEAPLKNCGGGGGKKKKTKNGVRKGYGEKKMAPVRSYLDLQGVLGQIIDGQSSFRMRAGML